MTNESKHPMTKEHILEKHFGFSYYHKHEYIRNEIFEAMEEYASTQSSELRAENEQLKANNRELIKYFEACRYILLERGAVSIELESLISKAKELTNPVEQTKKTQEPTLNDLLSEGCMPEPDFNSEPEGESEESHEK